MPKLRDIKLPGKRMRRILALNVIVMFMLTVVFPYAIVWAHRQATGEGLPVVVEERELFITDNATISPTEVKDTSNIGSSIFGCSIPPFIKTDADGVTINESYAVVTNFNPACTTGWNSFHNFEVDAAALQEEQITSMIFTVDTTSASSNYSHVVVSFIAWDDVDIDGRYTYTPPGTDKIVEHKLYDDVIQYGNAEAVEIGLGEFVQIQDAAKKTLENTVIIKVFIYSPSQDAALTVPATAGTIIGSIETVSLKLIGVEQSGTATLSSDMLALALIFMSVVILLLAMLASKEIKWEDIS